MSDAALSVAAARHPARPAAIDVDELSASYRLRIDGTSMRSDMFKLFGRRGRRDRIVPALRDVSFDVPRGSVLGVIGRNGAGKSTLLRVIAGILPPERGRVVVRGRISTLLSVGVGFDKALTGRKNIELGGLAIGLTPDRLVELTDSIAEFAQLDEYLDYPLRAYSQGMKARLGFAVVAHLDPEVLLIDEALSGGDAAFGERVRQKMAELCSQGRTIVIVTHGLSSVRTMCTDAIWLHQGRIEAQGDPDDVVARYMRYCRLEELELPDELE